MKKVICVVLLLGLVASPIDLAWAGEGTATFRAASSALIPGTGQIMDDDFSTGIGRLKVITMWLVELGAIITTPILGATHGWPIVMVGVGIFALNHGWSSYDAYERALAPGGAPTEGSTVR